MHACHPERSEGSPGAGEAGCSAHEILRCAQDDMECIPQYFVKVHYSCLSQDICASRRTKVTRYILQRLFFIIPVALIVCFLTFMVIHLVPGDPARVLLGPEATPDTVAALRQQLGLDKPLLVQFGLWFWQLLHGNLGQSIQLQQPVWQAIQQRLPVTAELGVAALIFSLVIAVPLGIYSATHRDTWVDWLVNVLTLISTAIPSFVLGLVLLFLFAVTVRVVPT